MTGRNRGRGQGDGCGGRNGPGGHSKQGRGSGYSSKPKTIKVGLCKELEGHIFNYGGHGAADTMRVTQEKIQQYVGIKFGEDIANKIKIKKLVVLTPPKYSNAIKLRHQEYEKLVRRKQGNLKKALEVKLSTLQAEEAAGEDVDLEIANLQNDIDDLEFESHQEVPYKLTMEEAAGYSNSAKAHSLREATLKKHRGQVYALIYGQCTQLLQDKLKQEKSWAVVSASYKPLELYKLIESVVLKQTEDQYPVAAVWDQYSAVFNARQGSLSNTEWYERFNTKVEVAESVGCVFGQDKILDYCAEMEFKSPYNGLSTAEQAEVEIQAREQFMVYGLLKTSSNSHDKVKSDLSDDFTKGSNNYPTTPQGMLLLLDKYSKKPMAMTQSEGTAFAQKEAKKSKSKKVDSADPKKVEFDKEFYKDKECYRCGKKGHPKAGCTVKLVAADNDKSTKSSASKVSVLTGSTADVGKMFTLINKTFKTMGKAMSQVSKVGAFADDGSIGAQSHAHYASFSKLENHAKNYAFAIGADIMRECLLLDNQSSVHVFCN
jgi:hypothetical protein